MGAALHKDLITELDLPLLTFHLGVNPDTESIHDVELESAEILAVVRH